MANSRVDIVAPVYNEAACLLAFYEALAAAIAGLPYQFHILLVDDGSVDGTPQLARDLCSRDPRLRYVRLSRNFGHQAALTAGLDLADGDAVITMDSDLQHPPDRIGAFLEAWRAGAEVVHGRRASPQSGLPKHLTSKLFYRMLRAMVDIPLVMDSPDYRLLDRRAVRAMRALREQGRFLRGIYAWIGFKQVAIEYREGGRFAGRSKYNLPAMTTFALSAVLSFSRAPLRAATWLGLSVSSFAFLFGVYAVYQALVTRDVVPGWTSLAVLISLLSGVQLVTLGIVGEYVGLILDEVKRRPLYLIAEDSAEATVVAPLGEGTPLPEPRR